jgi:hypothetical protein
MDATRDVMSLIEESATVTLLIDITVTETPHIGYSITVVSHI